MSVLIRFMSLVVLLNVLRYVVVSPLEALVVFEPLWEAMEQQSQVFNLEFARVD